MPVPASANRMLCLLCAAATALSVPFPSSAPADTLVVLPEVEVSEVREAPALPVLRQAQQVVGLSSAELRQQHHTVPKDAAASVPNMHIPDYGSAMTSSIYIRGLGSRIDEPVMGIVVDGIPLLDKNMFDFRLQDVRRMEVLRGPQGTLYGRNTMGGIMEIHTLLPLDVDGRLFRVTAGYGNARTMESALSLFRRETARFGWSFSARYDRTGGFYTNRYDGRRVDYGQTAGGRLVVDGRTAAWRLTGTLSADWVSQGAFPYADAATGLIDYNDPGAYRRLNIVEGLHAVREGDRWQWHLAASYQYLGDHMQMDNDYTPVPVFTLEQKQHLHGATWDVLVRRTLSARCDLQAGASAFFKQGDMSAPVTFLRGGIDELILRNANNGIRRAFPSDSLEIAERQFVVASDFVRLNAGAALYGQGSLRPTTRLTLRLGVRMDAEHVHLDYDSRADLHYRMTALMSAFKPFRTALQGSLGRTYGQCLPRMSVQYDWPQATLYAYAAKGSKAGGFNTQIFSTIVQNRMMQEMMADMGVHLDDIGDSRYTSADITVYRPERAWTFEAGTHWQPLAGLRWDADLFAMTVRDMQVTVFPEGKTAGRMMTNAAEAFSAGAETSLRYRWQRNAWDGLVTAAYGFTDARFVRFDDGRGDYSGKHVPYAPQHTASATCSTTYALGHKALQAVSLSVSAEGRGRIWWNEQNTLSQPFYALMNLSLALQWEKARILFWSRNLTGTRYDVFHFVSMDNAFLQRAKPCQFGLQCSVNL